VIRREALKNRPIELAVIAIVFYAIAFYVFDLPDWLKIAAGIVLSAGWLYLFVVYPTVRAVKRRAKGHS